LNEHIRICYVPRQELKLEDNTMIVFTADNGHEIYYSQEGRVLKPYTNMQTGERFDDYKQKYYSYLSGDSFDGNGGRAGLKRSNLEGGINVPLIVKWPGREILKMVSMRKEAYICCEKSSPPECQL